MNSALILHISFALGLDFCHIGFFDKPLIRASKLVKLRSVRCLSNALKKNTVRYNLSYSSECIFLNFSTQTLNILDLGVNRLGTGDVSDLMSALQINQVKFSHSFQVLDLCFSLIFLTQTLTTLDISYSKIGSEGAELVAKTLTNNIVTKTIY
jgi:hypothetical protein